MANIKCFHTRLGNERENCGKVTKYKGGAAKGANIIFIKCSYETLITTSCARCQKCFFSSGMGRVVLTWELSFLFLRGKRRIRESFMASAAFQVFLVQNNQSVLGAVLCSSFFLCVYVSVKHTYVCNTHTPICLHTCVKYHSSEIHGIGRIFGSHSSIDFRIFSYT